MVTELTREARDLHQEVKGFCQSCSTEPVDAEVLPHSKDALDSLVKLLNDDLLLYVHTAADHHRKIQ